MTDSKEERIKKWLKGKKAGPWMMEAHPTDRCNLSCIFCWRNVYAREEDELKDEKWVEIVRDGAKMGLKHLTIVGGGEPLLRPQLVRKLIEVARNEGIEGSLVTNGTLITSELAKHLVENAWDGVAFSINSVSPKIDNFLRDSQNAFQMSLKGIKYLNYWKKKLKSEKPALTLHPTINRYNYSEIVEMVKFSYKIGMDILLLRLVNDRSGRFTLDHVQSKKLFLLVKKAADLAHQKGVEFIYEFTSQDLGLDVQGNDRKPKLESEVWLGCPKPFFEIMISADGTTSPCCLICESRFKPGGPGKISDYLDDVKNKKLKEVWFGKVFNFFRRSVIKSLPPPCQEFCTTDQKYRIATGRLLTDRW